LHATILSYPIKFHKTVNIASHINTYFVVISNEWKLLSANMNIKLRKECETIINTETMNYVLTYLASTETFWPSSKLNSVS